jgi:hypothetical protein
MRRKVQLLYLVSWWFVWPVRVEKRLLFTRTCPDSPQMMAQALFGFCISLKNTTH